MDCWSFLINLSLSDCVSDTCWIALSASLAKFVDETMYVLRLTNENNMVRSFVGKNNIVIVWVGQIWRNIGVIKIRCSKILVFMNDLTNPGGISDSTSSRYAQLFQPNELFLWCLIPCEKKVRGYSQCFGHCDNMPGRFIAECRGTTIELCTFERNLWISGSCNVFL